MWVMEGAEFSPVPSDMQLRRLGFKSAGRTFWQSEGFLLIPLLISGYAGFSFPPLWVTWHVFLQALSHKLDLIKFFGVWDLFSFLQSFYSYPHPEVTAFPYCWEEAPWKALRALRKKGRNRRIKHWFIKQQINWQYIAYILSPLCKVSVSAACVWRWWCTGLQIKVCTLFLLYRIL